MRQGHSRQRFSRVCAAVACAVLLGPNALGVTLWISDVSVVPRDEKTAILQFNISWEGSWRNEVNHDAAWVFFKAKIEDEPALPAHWSRPAAAGKAAKPQAESEKAWQHVRLAANRVMNPDGYGQTGDGTPVECIVPDGPDGFTGVFLRRATYGRPKALKANGVTVLWDLTATQGVTKKLKAQVRGYGIEMVYVPEGPFYLGTGGAEANAFYQYTDGVHNAQPYRVTSADPIPTGRKNGCLWAGGATPQDGGEIQAAFPNGYRAFYCMKDTISRRQYSDFMNALSPAQADARYHPRIVIRSGKGPDHVYHPYAAAHRYGTTAVGLSWADGAAFAAWAALRPITEMELEKAVRGPCDPIQNEVGPSVWGLQGFSEHDWHALKLIHQSERAVTIGNAAGRLFRGTHGHGSLDLPADWPQEDAVGAGMRCSYWGFGNLENARSRALMSDIPFYIPAHEGALQMPRARLSDRLNAALVDPDRQPHHRWRGVRTVPPEADPAMAVTLRGPSTGAGQGKQDTGRRL
ncbi:MAG: hypothetical protein FJ222_04390 [Lentisphaerae bacterium]|nr:hypothetical protein [Lentisphaerota bacterium]